MKRHMLPLAAALVLTAASIITAHAHASLEKSESPAGSYKAVMRIPHGCGEQATNVVRIDLPEGFIQAKPMPKAGWQVEVEKSDYAKTYMNHGKEVKSGVKSVTWKGGDLPTDFYDEFVISGTLADVEAGSSLAFPTVQTCKEGTVSWTELAKDGQDPHALEHPAPLLKIAASDMSAHDHGMGTTAAIKVGDLEISQGWIRATLPGQPAAGGFLTIDNKGKEADRLLSASSPLTAVTQVHEMKMEGDVMKMAELADGLEIPAGSKIELKPGGFHLMFMGLEKQVMEGESVKVTLTFEKAGSVEVELPVQPADAKGMQHGDGHMNHGQLNMDGMADPQQIEHLMKAQFDKPEAPLTVNPVVIQGDFAIGGWAQDKAGGYALLKRTDGKWAIHLCTGAAVKEEANLVKMSVPADDARTLSATLAAELAKLDPAVVDQLDSFEGTIMIEGGHHQHGG